MYPELEAKLDAWIIQRDKKVIVTYRELIERYFSFLSVCYTCKLKTEKVCALTGIYGSPIYPDYQVWE